ncbi:4-hydroxy-2-oxo-heptane-1,7-dioate aldolase, partial [Escherichia coli]
GVVIGPAALSAAMGHRGNPGHPEAQAAIEDAIHRIRTSTKAAAILSANETLAPGYLGMSCAFVVVGLYTSLLLRLLS